MAGPWDTYWSLPIYADTSGGPCCARSQLAEPSRAEPKQPSQARAREPSQPEGGSRGSPSANPSTKRGIEHCVLKVFCDLKRIEVHFIRKVFYCMYGGKKVEK